MLWWVDVSQQQRTISQSNISDTYAFRSTFTHKNSTYIALQAYFIARECNGSSDYSKVEI